MISEVESEENGRREGKEAVETQGPRCRARCCAEGDLSLAQKLSLRQAGNVNKAGLFFSCVRARGRFVGRLN